MVVAITAVVFFNLILLSMAKKITKSYVDVIEMLTGEENQRQVSGKSAGYLCDPFFNNTAIQDSRKDLK